MSFHICTLRQAELSERQNFTSAWLKEYENSMDQRPHPLPASQKQDTDTLAALSHLALGRLLLQHNSVYSACRCNQVSYPLSRAFEFLQVSIMLVMLASIHLVTLTEFPPIQICKQVLIFQVQVEFSQMLFLCLWK